MFSLRARSRLLASGVGFRSLLVFAADSWNDARAQVRAAPEAVGRIWRFSVPLGCACAAALAPIYTAEDRAADLPVALAATIFATFLVTAWIVMHVGMLNEQAIGVANHLTIARFILIAPATVLFAHGLYLAGIVAYAVLGLTDVADGIVARRRDERSEFGVVMDPLADVVSTAAVFAALTVRGLVPSWLLILLLVRYAMLIIGSHILFVIVGRYEIRATVTGKIVGVVQALGVVAIVLGSVVWHDAWERLSPRLFQLLGLGFASIIVSQLVIGLRHLSRWRKRKSAKEVEIGSQG